MYKKAHINTGLRPGEICALTEDDIDFDAHEISVTKTLLYQKLDGDEGKEFHLGPPKTDSSVRTVPMNEVCEETIRKQIRLKKCFPLNIRKAESLLICYL